MFSVVVSILLSFVIFRFVRFTVLAVSLISRDIVVCSSSASRSSIASPPLSVSFLNHVMCPLSESERCRFIPEPLVITIFRLLGPDGGMYIAGFCLAFLSPTFGTIGVVVSFVAGGIQNMSLPRVGETSYTSFRILSVVYLPSTVVYLCVCSVVRSARTSCIWFVSLSLTFTVLTILHVGPAYSSMVACDDDEE